jgi:hypothetical protein
MVRPGRRDFRPSGPVPTVRLPSIGVGPYAPRGRSGELEPAGKAIEVGQQTESHHVRVWRTLIPFVTARRAPRPSDAP